MRRQTKAVKVNSIGAAGSNVSKTRSSVSAVEANRRPAIHCVPGDANRPSSQRDGQLKVEGGRIVADGALLPIQVIKLPNGQCPAVSECVSVKENVCAVTPTSIASCAVVVAVDDAVAHDLDVESRRKMGRA